MNETKDTTSNFVSDYFSYWDNLIHDLELMADSSDLSEGRATALLLALCYTEALGKLLLYDDQKSAPRPSKIFAKTMRLFNISRANAEEI